MLAARMYDKNDLRVEEVATPEIGEEEVLLRVRAAAICGTDVRMLGNGYPGIAPETPRILGHEVSGEICRVGSRVTGYTPGQRVSVAPNMGCGVCGDCVSGNSHLCRSYRALGIHLDGGFAEYMRIPAPAVRQGNITPLADHVSFAEAAINEALSCVCNGFERCDIRPGESVLVVGAGPIGIMHAMLARMAGAGRVYISDLSAERLATAKAIDDGFITVEGDVEEVIREDLHGAGVDVCITACPSPAAQAMALRVCGNNGRINFFGGVPATAAIARTSVAIKSGQQTRLTSVFHSVFLLASMFLLGGVMARLPLSALAGVLMVTAWRMNDWAGIRYIFAHRFKSAISQFLVTMLATVVFDLTVAIILGVIYSAILYVARSSRIHVAFSTIDGNRLRYDVGKSPILDSAGVVYVTGSLFFGAVDEFNHRLQDIPEEDHLILSLRGMPSVDVSGAQAVLELCQRLLAKGHTIAFCGVAEDVRSYFDRAGVTALVGESAYYHSADRAILALLDEELLEA